MSDSHKLEKTEETQAKYRVRVQTSLKTKNIGVRAKDKSTANHS